MTKSDREDFFKRVLQKTIEPLVVQLLESKDFAKAYATRDDQKEINKKVRSITEKAAELLVEKLEKKNLLEKRDASEKEFKELLDESVKEALAVTNGLKDSKK